MPGDKILQLKESSKTKLKQHGLETSQHTYRYQITISKPDSVKGNTISLINTPYEEEGLTEFSPMLELKKIDNKWVVEHWECIPGPGRGDFTLDFDKEEDAIDFILSYYFTENKYFTEKQVEMHQNRMGVDLNELGIILEKAMDKLKGHVSSEDFIPFETGFYNKLTVANWKDFDPQNDPPKDVKVEMAFIPNDTYNLKDLLTQNRSFESEDFEKIAAIFMEFANLTRNEE